MKKVYMIGLLLLIHSLETLPMIIKGKGGTVTNQGYMDLGGRDMFGSGATIQNSGTVVNPGPNTKVINIGEGKVLEAPREQKTPQQVEMIVSSNINQEAVPEKVEAEKTYSGKISLRISPALHAQLAQEAAQRRISLNSLIIEKIQR